MYWQLQTNGVLVVSVRSTNTHACMPWLLSGNGNNWHFQQFCDVMYMTIIGLKDCNKYDNNIFPVIQDQIQYDGITHTLYKIQGGHPKKKWFR